MNSKAQTVRRRGNSTRFLSLNEEKKESAPWISFLRSPSRAHAICSRRFARFVTIMSLNFPFVWKERRQAGAEAKTKEKDRHARLKSSCNARSLISSLTIIERISNMINGWQCNYVVIRDSYLMYLVSIKVSPPIFLVTLFCKRISLRSARDISLNEISRLWKITSLPVIVSTGNNVFLSFFFSFTGNAVTLFFRLFFFLFFFFASFEAIYCYETGVELISCR